MDNNSEKIIGNLFESIGYSSIEDLRNLIDNLTFEQSILFINKSIEYSYNKGVFSMVETELISKSLSVLHKKVLNNNVTDVSK